MRYKYRVNEPILLMGKHRNRGEITEYIENNDKIDKLVGSKALTIVVPTRKGEIITPVGKEKIIDARGKQGYNKNPNKKKTKFR